MFSFPVSSVTVLFLGLLNSKAKTHVTLQQAVLEEIGNRVTTGAMQIAKKAQTPKYLCNTPKQMSTNN